MDFLWPCSRTWMQRLLVWHLITWTVSARIQLRQLRHSLLDLARTRINVWYTKSSHFTDPVEQDGVSYRLSKLDKACDGDGVPVTFSEFDVDGVRPVDVFNVVADAANQTTWDSSCEHLSWLQDDPHAEARGWLGVLKVPPLQIRKAYEWQVADANFTAEDFWIVFSSLKNGALKQDRPPESDAVATGATHMKNCLIAYRITRSGSGAKVVRTVQANTHVWPVSPRYLAEMGLQDIVDFAKRLKAQSHKQREKKWNDTQVSMPEWMLQNRPCAPPGVDDGVRESLLLRAAARLQQPVPSQYRQRHIHSSGETIRLWQHSSPCSGAGVPPANVPVWHAEFIVPAAEPSEVFNVLVASAAAARWNPLLRSTSVLSFRSGAREIHEMIVLPIVARRRLRTIRLWQAASHDLAAGIYLVALASPATERKAPAVQGTRRASQCLEAYSLRSAESNGTVVRLTSHFNPGLGNAVHSDGLWDALGEKALVDFAGALSTEVWRIAGLRARGSLLRDTIDSHALRLLSPEPADRNASETVAHTISLDAGAWLEAFATLNLPLVLNASAWNCPGCFEHHASGILQLFERARATPSLNVTTSEASAFLAGSAQDAVLLQKQGEALSLIQGRAIAIVTDFACTNLDLPDIDGDLPGSGFTLWALVGALTATVMVILAAGISCCCCRRLQRRWRDRRLRAAAVAALLHCDELPAACESSSLSPTHARQSNSTPEALGNEGRRSRVGTCPQV